MSNFLQNLYDSPFLLSDIVYFKIGRSPMFWLKNQNGRYCMP